MEFVTDPASWWIEPFTSNEFMRRALYAGLLLVLTTSVVGTWVVLRGMSFLGDALAHGVLPGIALAFIIGVDTTIGAFVAAMVMVWGHQRDPQPFATSRGHVDRRAVRGLPSARGGDHVEFVRVLHG